MMKPTKVMGSKCMIRESLLQCINSCKQLKSLKLKSKNDKLLLQTKMSVKNVKNKNKNYEAGEDEKPYNFKLVDLSKRIIANKIVKHKNEKNEKLQCPANNSRAKIKIIKMPSKIFSRKFSKYKDVQRKLKAKFKSTYNSSGKFGQGSTKYKAYVNTNKNKKNKSFFKYSMCSFGFNKEIQKKKRTVCPELPGKGTYNHRFAYDDALQLQRKGIKVDVLYKVKNKTDSIYVINGEFLWTKNKRSATRFKSFNKRKVVLDTADKITQEQNPSLISIQNKVELAKTQKANEHKKRLAKMALLEKEEIEKEKKKKLEQFIRERHLANIEKDLRAKELRKILREKSLKKKAANDEKKNQKQMQMEINRAKYVEKEKLKQLKLQKNITSINDNNNNNNTNTADNKQVISPKNHYDGLEIITDSNIINDIGQWVLQNDGTVFAMPWLKIVARRIDSLDGRIDTLYTNKWMQIAIDKVVDEMTDKKLMSDFSKKALSHRKLLCNKSVQLLPTS